MDNIFFNAHHSPIGAFATFTLGFKGVEQCAVKGADKCAARGARGGLGMEMRRPANQDIMIGLESPDDQSASGQKCYKTLPFYELVDKTTGTGNIPQKVEYWQELPRIECFGDDEIQRDFQAATDTWVAQDLTFRIYSPVRPIPDPDKAAEMDLKMAILPAVLAEITVDNTQQKKTRRVFFGFCGTDPYLGMRRYEDTNDSGISGVGQGNSLAIASRSPGIKSGVGMNVEEILYNELDENRSFIFGSYGLLMADVPAGEKKTYQFAVCFYHGGIVTSGAPASYYYTKFFQDIEQVAEFALEKYDNLVQSCLEANRSLAANHLSDIQKFVIAHAIHSYYANTQLLNYNGRPLWVVYEGEYRIMNTLDLTADQLFYEMKMNPWTVRNVLDFFVERYSYVDEVRFPGEERTYPGGLSFTHDIGIANIFSKPQYSSYELCAFHGCFSYMTHEELVNWLCCATVYILQTQDKKWVKDKLNVLKDCFRSMVNRDHPDPAKRNGIMKLDSTRARGGTEITTYDCLDASLGQSRNNLYLAGKCWAVYVALEKIFRQEGLTELAQEAGIQAERCTRTIVEHVREDGHIPAVFESEKDLKIIPAIEGLIFIYASGCHEALDPNGRFGAYIQALKRHFKNIMVPGVCLFEDGGWKLSSTSTNSWLSKIYLCQFVARKILGFTDLDPQADQAHLKWLLDEKESYWCWSDQIDNGEIIGSRYYPRGVTSYLWLEE